MAFDIKMSTSITKTVHVMSVVEGLVQKLSSKLETFFNEKNVHISFKFHDETQMKKLGVSDKVALLQDAEILIADPGLVPGSLLQQLPKLKWMQSTWAGVNATISTLDVTMPLPSCKLTKLSATFGVLIGEYTLAQILVHERLIIPLYENQKRKIWAERRFPRMLSEVTIGVLGVGNIGLEICRICSLHGMKTLGLGRTPREKPIPNVSSYYLYSGLREMLGQCDYICSILPSTPDTTGLLDGDILSCCAKKPLFINVGRGDVVSEESIIKALEAGWISAAVLDVFPVEPLPASSRLWDREDVIITPHCAGQTIPEAAVAEFIVNLKHYLDGNELDYIDWQKGY